MNTTQCVEAHPVHKPCQCKQAGHGECCELDCLVHPRFFCGQLLADQDLTALVDWIKQKTGLARFRHGWGVVCGLEVCCGPGGSVTVLPGYALDCCGRDVVLCQADTLDLSQCWKRSPSHCVDWPPGRGKSTKESTPEDIPFGGFKVRGAEVQVFDVLVRYDEAVSDARTALARGECGGAAGCEYTRVHEAHKLYCRPAHGCEDPNLPHAMEWFNEYQAEREKKRKELLDLGQIKDSDTRLQSVIEYLRRCPLSTFCFLCDWVQDSGAKSELPKVWDELALWLLQDWRIARFRTPCRGCGPDSGILLARVWLRMRKDDNSGKDVFTTLLVNSHAPFRRTLVHDWWPALTGQVNLAPYIWAQAEAAELSLKQRGFSIQRASENPAQLFNGLQKEDLFASADRELTMHLCHDPGCNQLRVVYFKVSST